MNLLRYYFWRTVDFTEQHFDSIWLLLIASVVVFFGLCFIFLK